MIGLGKISRAGDLRSRAFGASVTTYDAYPATPEIEQELGIRRVPLAVLLQQADIVTLHVPLNNETRNRLIQGTRDSALMKPTALLINACRGPVVDEAALAPKR